MHVTKILYQLLETTIHKTRIKSALPGFCRTQKPHPTRVIMAIPKTKSHGCHEQNQHTLRYKIIEIKAQTIDNNGHIILDVESKNTCSTCHKCGHPATKRNGTAPMRLIRHLPIFDTPVYLRITPVRYWGSRGETSKFLYHILSIRFNLKPISLTSLSNFLGFDGFTDSIANVSGSNFFLATPHTITISCFGLQGVLRSPSKLPGLELFSH